MSFEEEFDGIIRRKAEETSVPFNEADWQKASAMLDAQRKPVALSWVYFAAAAMLISAGIFWFYTGESTATTTVASKSNVTNVATATPDNEDQVTTNHLPVETMEHQVSAAPHATTNLRSEKVPAMANDVEEHKVDSHSQPEPRFENLVKNKPVINTNKEQNDQIATSATVSGNGENGDKNGEEKNFTVASGTEDHAVPITNTEASNQQKKGSATTSEQEPVLLPETKSELAINQPVMAPPAGTEEATNNYSDNSWMYLQSKLNNPSNEEEISSNVVAIHQPDPDDYSQVRLKMHYARLGAGALASNGWQGASKTDGKCVSALFAGEYGIYFTKRFSLTTGLKYWQLSNIHSPWYKVTSISYNYFYTTNSAEITTTAMQFLSIPVGISWHPHRRHQITAGMQLNTMLAAENTWVYSGPIETTGANRVEQKSGLYNGMNVYTWAAQMGYRYEFMHRLSLMANVQLQLQSFFNGNVSSSATNHPLFVSGGLTYTLFDK